MEKMFQPKSYCRCGHTGDGDLSDHMPALGITAGHGPCSLCACEKFTWGRWTDAGELAAREYIAEKNKERKQ